MVWQKLIEIFLQLSLKAGKKPEWPWGLPEELVLIFAIVWFFISLFVLAVVLYVAGLIVVGRKRALFSDAFIISLVGTVLTTLFTIFIPYPLIALILSVFVWLVLIKRLFETGWLGAIAVGILAIIIYLAILVLLAFAFHILEKIFEWLRSTWPFA
ncbi:hypothetical protein KEJ32_03000 [Candidatus Bathyarchaeota archaeon]|nr:hypothetical protein [Candidatus Bathyarchaeota archaeon]MBS7636625.1 hypothetical protein [Candidatus Bathyarchaeota archaeon]